MESAGTGILAGINAVRLLGGQPLLVMDNVTMLGALVGMITDPHNDEFQPINANFGILPPLPSPPKDKKQRYAEYALRSAAAMEEIQKIMSRPVEIN